MNNSFHEQTVLERTFNIHKYLPKCWEEVYLDQWIAIKGIDPSLGFYARQWEILAILTDTLTDDPCWEDLDITVVTQALKSLKWLSIEPSSTHQRHVNDLTVIDINKLTLGEFIDLEYYFKDYNTNLDKIAAILYRKTMLDEWGNTKWEPHASYDIDERAKSFHELPVTKFHWLIPWYLEFKDTILTTYSNLFEPNIPLDEDLSEEELEEDKAEEIRAKWSWEITIHNLTDGDITKWDHVTSLPLIMVLNQLSFRKEMKIE